VTVTIRPLRDDDVEAARSVQLSAFGADPSAPGAAELPPGAADRQRARFRHFLAHDPAGSWAAVAGDHVVGTALALRRGDLWGLSLLAVDPACQSRGVGSRLLSASLAYADGARRAVILSTEDHRAMRAYARAGFDLHPQVAARGRVEPAREPHDGGRVRAGSTDDAAFADGVDLAVRAAPRGPDHALLGATFAMFVVDDGDGRGYAYLRSDGEVVTVAATDDATAAALLWRCIAAAGERGQDAVVEHIAANQQWAVRVVLDAGMTLRPSGPVFWRGGAPPASYLPSGAYL
jgi:GNAT superfamily N-acetyltransferase